MKIRSIALIVVIFCCGCSVVIVWSPKHVRVTGEGNAIEIKGSELKDNQAKQESSGAIEIPFLP